MILVEEKNMKKSTVGLWVTSGTLALVLFFPGRVSAFWPFDYFTGNGEVKGVATESSHTSFFQSLIQKFGGTNTDDINKMKLKIQEQEQQLQQTNNGGIPPNVSDKLTQAVTNGKITSTQRDEILSRLNAIKAKREELTKLEMDLKNWMIANKLTTEILGTPPMMGNPTNRGPQGGTSPRPTLSPERLQQYKQMMGTKGYPTPSVHVEGEQ